MTRIYDYVVVGAGPSGLAFLSEINHASVALVEKCKLPRQKLCGGVLKEEVLNLLPDLPDEIFVEPRRLNLIYIDLDNRKFLETEKVYYNIDREKFDFWLFQRINKKFDFFENTVLCSVETHPDYYALHLFDREKKKKFTILSRFVIAADGANSKIRRQVLREPCKYYIGIQFKLFQKHPENHFYFIFDSNISIFYSWVIPKNSFTIVGSALLPGENPKEKISSILKRYQFILGSSNFAGFYKSSALVRGFPEDVCLGRERIFFVGEAAGLVSPKSGEGISFALRSGIFCARALNQGGELSRYFEIMKPVLFEIRKKFDKYRRIFKKRNRLVELEDLVVKHESEKYTNA